MPAGAVVSQLRSNGTTRNAFASAAGADSTRPISGTVKSQLARGVPVIFAIRSGPRLVAHRGDGVFDTPEDAPGIGHAMLVTGYDDARRAFRIQNSWGREWGDGGYAWYSYDLWLRSVQVGFVID